MLLRQFDLFFFPVPSIVCILLNACIIINLHSITSKNKIKNTMPTCKPIKEFFDNASFNTLMNVIYHPDKYRCKNTNTY